MQLQKHLNESQLEAVTTIQGPILVIAGAGSGKTRTIVYRLAHLVNQGINPGSILLLTFTRKAAQEMMNRAGRLLGQNLQGISGGTFHSFAYGVLRNYASILGFDNDFTVLDRSDSEDIVKQVKEIHAIGRSDRSFPKKNTLISLISKSRNKELQLEELLEKEMSHLIVYAQEIQDIFEKYQDFKKKHNLMDYDDLLFNLEQLLLQNEDIRQFLQMRHPYLMLDEYQDTNLVQGRISRILAGEEGNIMAVGDDAQSIYSFRGASIENILQFTKYFPRAKIIKLEENYRSTQPILDLGNKILEGAREKYQKNLFTQKTDGAKPLLMRSISDLSQAQMVLQKLQELGELFEPSQIAVLFRAGYQAYSLELALNKAQISYKKYGGMKFTEAAHIKDVLAHLRLVSNPADLPAFQRVMSLIPKIGPKTTQKLYTSITKNEKSYLHKTCAQNPDLKELLDLISQLQQGNLPLNQILQKVLDYYQPQMQEIYADDYPRRLAGLEQLSQIGATYQDLQTFLADMNLQNADDFEYNRDNRNTLVLSTVHSAKGLEWDAVLIIDLVEDRFPSRHAVLDQEAMEEERRLFYVACTRAKQFLGLCVPDSLFNRFQNRSETARVSPFVQELRPDLYHESRESYLNGMQLADFRAENPEFKTRAGEQEEFKPPRPEKLGYGSHKIFGRGKVVGFVPPDKYRVNFPGFGIKLIIADYLTLEE